MIKNRLRKILDVQLMLLDQIADSSHRRALEMAVDAVVTFNPGYAVQFWKDVRLYGIDEAKAYLIRFIESNYQSPEDLAVEVNAVCEIINGIHDSYEKHRDEVIVKMGREIY